MTDTELRIKVAELVGFSDFETQEIWEDTYEDSYQIAILTGTLKNEKGRRVPHYESDLNAMHEAVEAQCNKDAYFRFDFTRQLTEEVKCLEDVATATAKQRALAFVKTMEQGDNE
jgi:hypothetical protein